MKLLHSPQAHAALIELQAAVDGEAEAAGETVHLLLVTAFTKEDVDTVATAVSGCSCEFCMRILKDTLTKIGAGKIEGHDLIPAGIH